MAQLKNNECQNLNVIGTDKSIKKPMHIEKIIIKFIIHFLKVILHILYELYKRSTNHHHIRM